ncbi:MAG: caspase family protein [Saprospiraceae bacterium]|nr:caspase family protein [Saprospiraceae bacterium]
MKKNILPMLLLLAGAAALAQKPRLVVPIGHTGFVNAVAFSPDGSLVLTGSEDNTAILWDLAGRELQSYAEHKARISSVAFSPNGQYVLTGSADNTAIRRDLDGSNVLKLEGHTGAVSSVAFAPKDKWMLTASRDSTARLWDAAGKNTITFRGHTGAVTAAVFSADGQFVLTASRDSTARLWDVKGNLKQIFKGHSHWVSSVFFLSDGKTILTTSLDKSVRLWDLKGNPKSTFNQYAESVNAMALLPVGQLALTGSDDKTARLWSISGEPKAVFTGHTGYVGAVAFSPDGQLVLTGSEDQTARLWSLDGKERGVFAGRSSSVNAAVWSPTGTHLLTAQADHTARLWNLTQPVTTTLSGHAGALTSAAFSPDGSAVLTGSQDRSAKRWNLKGVEQQAYAGRHTGNVTAVAFTPDGRIITGSRDRKIAFWGLDGAKGEEFEFSGPVASIALSANGNVLAGVGQNPVLLNTETGTLKTSSGHRGAVMAIAASPDGNTWLTASQDRTARLWSIDGEATLRPLSEHTNWVSAVAFSPATQQDAIGGSLFLTGSYDNTAKLWNYTGESMRTFSGHAGWVTAVGFSPDSEYVLTGSADNTAKIWNRSTGEPLATLIALENDEWAVTTPSGLFDASPGAMRLMYFVVNQEVIELEQLKERYYEPGLLAKILGRSEEQIRSVAGLDTVGLYPLVTLQLDTLKSILHIELKERSGGVGKVSVFVNGKEIVEDANPPKGGSNVREKAFSIDLERHERFFLPDTLNFVSVRAYNADNWLKSAPHELRYVPEFVRAKGGDGQQPATGAASERRSRRPALHVILVGTADYAGKTLDLKYAAKDAADMASALKQTGELLFKPGNVTVHLLSTEAGQTPPTKKNIHDTFQSVANAAKAEDVLITYFSGHGITYGEADRALFYYLTMDIATPNLSDAGIRTNRAISSSELTEWTKNIPALKQVMILDACNSGKVAEIILAAGEKSLASTQIRALDRMKDRTGMFVLTGSAADMVSYEAGRFGQSLLTYSLLDGMIRSIDEKSVDVMKLFQGARDRVPDLATEIGGIQTPMMAFPVGSASFDIGLMDETVKIELQQPKPVFIRNIFLDEDRFDDSIGFTEEIENLFREKTAKGGSAELVFVDVKQFTDAYSIKGLYKVSGHTVTLRGRLFKGAVPVGEAFEVAGNKNELAFLADDVWEKVRGMVK